MTSDQSQKPQQLLDLIALRALKRPSESTLQCLTRIKDRESISFQSLTGLEATDLDILTERLTNQEIPCGNNLQIDGPLPGFSANDCTIHLVKGPNDDGYSRSAVLFIKHDPDSGNVLAMQLYGADPETLACLTKETIQQSYEIAEEAHVDAAEEADLQNVQNMTIVIPPNMPQNRVEKIKDAISEMQAANPEKYGNSTFYVGNQKIGPKITDPTDTAQQNEKIAPNDPESKGETAKKLAPVLSVA